MNTVTFVTIVRDALLTAPDSQISATAKQMIAEWPIDVTQKHVLDLVNYVVHYSAASSFVIGLLNAALKHADPALPSNIPT